MQKASRIFDRLLLRPTSGVHSNGQADHNPSPWLWWACSRGNPLARSKKGGGGPENPMRRFASCPVSPGAFSEALGIRAEIPRVKRSRTN